MKVTNTTKPPEEQHLEITIDKLTCYALECMRSSKLDGNDRPLEINIRFLNVGDKERVLALINAIYGSIRVFSYRDLDGN